jgi:hypothetical protein
VGLAGEDKKDSLEGVVGRVSVVCDPAARAEHERTLAVHQRGESRLGRGFAVAGGKRGQQLGVGQGSERTVGEEDGPIVADYL